MRQHIFLGFAAILVPFLGIGICAFWLFSGISGALDVMVSDSQRWILAGKAMKESAERMDSTLSSALTGEEKKGRKGFESYAPAFERFLGHAGAVATLPGEGALADRIKEAEERYQELGKKFWNTSDVGMRRTMYSSELLPLFTEIDNELQAAIGVNKVNATRLG
jgi:hypothetical protein